jgi:hypothetical protein
MSETMFHIINIITIDVYCFLYIYFVTCSVKHVYDVVFTQQPIWKFLGNRFVEVHIRGNAQAKKQN